MDNDDEDQDAPKKKTVSFRIGPELLSEINQYADEHQLSQSDALRELTRRGVDSAKFMEILDQLDEQQQLLEDILEVLAEHHPSYVRRLKDRYF